MFSNKCELYYYIPFLKKNVLYIYNYCEIDYKSVLTVYCVSKQNIFNINLDNRIYYEMIT